MMIFEKLIEFVEDHHGPATQLSSTPRTGSVRAGAHQRGGRIRAFEKSISSIFHGKSTG
jgi:hypothetical protein